MLKVNPTLKKYVDDLVAASIAAIHPAKIKTGTYIGNGADNRNINIGVDLASKSNVYVIVKCSTEAGTGYHRIEYGQGDKSMVFSKGLDENDKIQAFTATGFQIGSSSAINLHDMTYRYIAFWEES